MLTKIVRADGSTLENIKSCVFTEEINADTDLRVGCVASASISVDAFGGQEDAPSAGEALTYYQVDEDGNETKIGIFYAEPSIETKDSYSFLAYDAVKKLDADFSEYLSSIQDSFPMTVFDIVNHAADVGGVTLVSDLSFPLLDLQINAFSYANITCRNIFSWAAEIAGRFVRCNTDGEIIFDWYVSAEKSIAPSDDNGAIYYKQDGLKYENYTTSELDRVAVYQTNIDSLAYIYPSDVENGNTYDVSGNMLLMDASDATYTTVAQNIYNVLSSLGTYRPCSVQLFPFNNPFRAGDKIKVTDSQGVTFTMLVMSMVVDANGVTLSCTGNQEYANASSSQNAQIIALTENAKSASDTNQYFWFKSSGADAGAHITEIPKDQFIASPRGNNLRTSSNRLAIRNELTELATFSTDGVQIGQYDKPHMIMSADSVSAFNEDGNKFFNIDMDGSTISGLWSSAEDWDENPQYIQLSASHTSDYITSHFVKDLVEDSEIKWNDLSYRISAENFKFDTDYTPSANNCTVSLTEDYITIAVSNIPTMTEGTEGTYAFYVDGVHVKNASFLLYIEFTYYYDGEDSFVVTLDISYRGAYDLEQNNISFYPYAITSYDDSKNPWSCATSLYYYTRAPIFTFGTREGVSGDVSASFGFINEVSGMYSFSAGQGNVVSGDVSAAIGSFLTAAGDFQFVVGQYNKNSKSNVFEVGNGDDEESTAFAVDSKGNVTLNGYENVHSIIFANYEYSGKSYIEAYKADNYGNNLLIQAGGTLVMGGGEYARNRYFDSLEGTTSEATYIGSDSTLYLESNANTIGNAKRWTLATSGNFLASETAQGVYGVDQTGFQYPYVRDNGANLWIGANETAAQHHTGRTYISSGHDGSNGNATIYVSVPNANNNNATNYGVYHTGNKPTPSAIGAVAKSGDTMTGTLNGTSAVYSGTVDVGGNGAKFRTNSDMNSAIGSGSSLSANYVIGGLVCRDAQNDSSLYINSTLTTADTLYGVFGVQRYNASYSTLIRNAFYLNINSSGTPTVSFNSNTVRDAWSSALGLKNAISNTDGSAVNVATSSDTTLCNTGSMAAGTWLIICAGAFAANATGRRVLYLASSTSGSNLNRYCIVQHAATPSGTTNLQFTFLVTLSSATTYYLRAWQNSGSTLSTTGGIRKIMLHP